MNYSNQIKQGLVWHVASERRQWVQTQGRCYRCTEQDETWSWHRRTATCVNRSVCQDCNALLRDHCHDCLGTRWILQNTTQSQAQGHEAMKNRKKDENEEKYVRVVENVADNRRKQ